MRNKIFIFLLSISAISAQLRSGVFVGAQYEITKHTNPYVVVNGTNVYDPTSVTSGFSDNTNYLYFPFGYANYSEDGYSEMSTYSFHLLFVGILNLLGSKEYKFTTDKVYLGDSYADGYVPVLDNSEAIGKQYTTIGANGALEASFADMDLFRIAFSGSLKEYIGLPITIGMQGGLGNMGIHFAKVLEGHEPTPLNNDNTGLVNFNDAVIIYGGINAGFVTSLRSDDLLMVLAQYDWPYFIKGVEENQANGGRLTVDLTYFPFPSDQNFLKDVFFKIFVKNSTVPFMKRFSPKFPVDYSFTKIGIGVNYFLF